ncbi:MAG: signal peptide peptidase SppA [Spirochaetaceae bacterium]|jgi:protease-4|nr:signal peptide peptidase SppA [Spirochaetaceae bacterium]
MKYRTGAAGMVFLFIFIFLLGQVISADAGSDAAGVDSAAESQDNKPAAVQVPGQASKVRYLELSLYNEQAGFFFPSPDQPSLLKILQVIKKAGEDRNIRGIILNTSGFSADRTVLWELRDALETFKASGKKLIAFFDTADIDLYCMVSAADKIVMDDLGTLTFTGYVYGREYYRSTLEKIGIGIQELRYFNYKSAMESYTRSGLSDADRRQYGIYLDDIFNLTKKTLTEARSWTEAEFNTILNHEFLYSAQGAKAGGLVDTIGRGSAVIEAAQELEGRAIDSFVFWGDSRASLTGGYPNYRLRREFITSGEIAVVYANGETDLDQGMGTRYLASLIGELAGRRRTKAIVVRINSPGGSAEAADYLAEAIKDARYYKPVVVSMGPVAASGGYWASMYASHIVASPFTLTGSIGVIAGWFYDNGLYNKLGIAVDLLKRGDHADLGSGIIIPSRNLNTAEERRYRQLILDTYNNFLGKAADGRNMPVEDMEKLAQGRIYSGIAARDNRLADSLGGLGEALKIARGLAGIHENAKIVYNEYPKPGFIETFIARYLSVFIPAIKIPGRAGLFEGLGYRLSMNGKVMPILPLGAEEFTGMPEKLFPDKLPGNLIKGFQ